MTDWINEMFGIMDGTSSGAVVSPPTTSPTITSGSIRTAPVIDYSAAVDPFVSPSDYETIISGRYEAPPQIRPVLDSYVAGTGSYTPEQIEETESIVSKISGLSQKAAESLKTTLLGGTTRITEAIPSALPSVKDVITAPITQYTTGIGVAKDIVGAVVPSDVMPSIAPSDIIPSGVIPSVVSGAEEALGVSDIWEKVKSTGITAGAGLLAGLLVAVALRR